MRLRHVNVLLLNPSQLLVLPQREAGFDKQVLSIGSCISGLTV